MTRMFAEVEKQYKQHQEPAIMPIRKTEYSAGYDIPIPQNIKLKPKEQKMIWTDLKIHMPSNEFVMIHIRSSLAIKKQLSLVNNVGIIDADYCGNESNDGNIGMCIKNNGKDEVILNKGDFIAQAIFCEYKIADNCNFKDNRKGGFGSTTEGGQ